MNKREASDLLYDLYDLKNNDDDEINDMLYKELENNLQNESRIKKNIDERKEFLEKLRTDTMEKIQTASDSSQIDKIFDNKLKKYSVNPEILKRLEISFKRLKDKNPLITDNETNWLKSIEKTQ